MARLTILGSAAAVPDMDHENVYGAPLSGWRRGLTFSFTKAPVIMQATRLALRRAPWPDVAGPGSWS
jgi:hypothetical protein